MHTEGNNLPKVIQKSFELVIKERNPHLPVGNQQVMVKTGGLGGGCGINQQRNKTSKSAGRIEKD